MFEMTKTFFTIIKKVQRRYRDDCLLFLNCLHHFNDSEKTHFFFFFFPSFFFFPFLTSSFLKLPRPRRTMQPLHQACSCRVKGHRPGSQLGIRGRITETFSNTAFLSFIKIGRVPNLVLKKQILTNFSDLILFHAILSTFMSVT